MELLVVERQKFLIFPVLCTLIFPKKKDIFVCPIVENSTLRQVLFPTGSDFVDWFNHSLVYQGGSVVAYNTPLEKFPVFHRRGSILPLEVQSSIVGHGDESSSDALTLLVLHPRRGGSEDVLLREWKQHSQQISYVFEQGSLTFSVSAHNRTLLFCLKGIHVKSADIEKISGKKEFVPLLVNSDLTALKRKVFGWMRDSVEHDKLWIRIDGALLTKGCVLRFHGVSTTFNDF